MYYLTLFLLCSSSFALELPASFPKCCVNDPNIAKCIIDASKKVKPFIKNGIKEMEIKTLYPVVAPPYVINYGEGDTSFVANTNNFSFYGMDDYILQDLEFDPKAITMKGKFVFKALFTHCLYSSHKGAIINVPIVGSGIFGGLLGPLNISFSIKASLVNKGGEQYAKLSELKINSIIESYPMIFQGLKDESGPWGVSNDVLRENGKLIGEGISFAFDQVWRTFTIKYLEWFLNEIPYNKLFPCK